MKKYERYQDYVIKDGKLVGEFDQMYRDHDDPWDQSTREQSALEKLIALELIRRNCYKRVIEFGSGLGYFTAELATVCSQVLGVDVSKTAITRARQRHPYLTFEKADLLDFDVIRRFHPDCLLMAEITWYVLPKLEAFKAFLRTEFGGGGHM